MNKQHVHRDLIHAWADGARIQVLCWDSDGSSHTQVWKDTDNPDWLAYSKYRIKPRDFKNGAWYPVIHEDGFKVIGIYQDGAFIVNGAELHPENLDWIGEPLKKIHHPENRDLFSEPLKIDWPKESE